MKVLQTWLRGYWPLERQFMAELSKRSNTPQLCTYRGLRYECIGSAGHWGIVEG